MGHPVDVVEPVYVRLAVWSPMFPTSGDMGHPVGLVEPVYVRLAVWSPMSPKPGDMGHPADDSAPKGRNHLRFSYSEA